MFFDNLLFLSINTVLKQKVPKKSASKKIRGTFLNKILLDFYSSIKASITAPLTPIFENPPSLYKF